MAVSGSRNVRTKQFKEMFSQLPENIQALADHAYAAFLENPTAPVLANHELYDTRRGRHRLGSRAVSVTHLYRAIYVVDGDTNVWYWIGSHTDYDQFTGVK